MGKFEVKGINHIGFVVKNADETLRVWEAIFGVERETFENKELMARGGSLVLGGVRFTFNESTDPSSRWAKFLEDHGEGLEHIALTISDIDDACESAKVVNVYPRLKEHKPYMGCLTNFFNRGDLHATALELMEPQS